MGNKRKASLIVIVAIIAALAVFPFVSNMSFGITSPNAVSFAGQTTGSITSQGTHAVTLDAGTYMYSVTGGNGGGTGGGYGATIVSFAKFTETHNGMYSVNAGGGSGDINGGGQSEGYSNFAKPSGGSNGYSDAAGGGGGYSYAYETPSRTPSTAYTHASFAGYSSSPDRSSEATKYVGAPATRFDNAAQGNSAGTAGTVSINGVSRTVCWNNDYNTEWQSITSSGGGAGYFNGGGGGHPGTTKNEAGDFNWRATRFPGGGGVCSPNCYPVYAADAVLGAISQTAGMTFWRIDPVKFPTQSGATVSDPGTDVGTGRYTISSANSLIGNYITTDWVYFYRTRTSSSTNWDQINWNAPSTSVPTCPAGSEIQVLCRYVIYATGDTTTLTPCYQMKYNTAEAAAGDYDYIIYENILQFANYGMADCTAPKGATGLVYDGTAINLLTELCTTTNGARVDYHVYKNGSAGGGGTFYKAFSDMPTAVDAGTYYVYAKAFANGYYTDSDWKMCTVTIGKKANYITEDKIQYKWGTVYNGSGQTLFGGSVTFAGGTPYYICTTSLTTVPTGDGYTNIADAKSGVDAYTSSGDLILYILWVRTPGTSNYASFGWYTAGWYVYMRGAYLSMSGELNDDVDYDGQEHKAIKSVTKTFGTTSSTVQNNFTITYRYIGTHDKSGNSYFELNHTDACLSLAGGLKIKAYWKPKAGLSNPYNYESGSYEFPGEFYVKKLTNSDNVAVSGITPVADLKLGDDGTLKPIADAKVDLTIFGHKRANGITTYNNDHPTSSADEGHNNLSYCFTKNSDATKGEYISTKSSADLNEQISNYVIKEAGTWYLFFRVENHYNLETGTYIQGAILDIGGLAVGTDSTTGFTSAGTVTYDGNPHRVYQGTGLTLNEGLNGSLGTVTYAVSTSAVAPGLNSDEWVALDELNEPINQGTYYLFAKWTGSTAILPGATSFGSFTISQYTPASENLTFTGHDFSAWGTPLVSNALHYYYLTYDNQAHTLGTMGEIVTVSDASRPNVASAEFGNFAFALGTSLEETTTYVSQNEFNNLTIKDVGTDTYLWIKWSGGDNVKGGEMVYRYKSDDGFNYRPVFLFNQLKSNDSLSLADTNYATSKGNQPYQYDIITSGTSATFNGKPQSLFTANGTPAIKINGADYTTGITYSYLATTLPDDEVTVNSTDWVSSISAATSTDVGVYYLWVKIEIDSVNVQTSKVVKLIITPAAIIATESFAAYEARPIPIADLEYDYQPHQLIYPSGQISPNVEYSLDGENWTSDVTDPSLMKTEKGVYIVYYRGMALEPMFTTQRYEPTQKVEVTISGAGVDYRSRPKKIDGVVYTGREIPSTSLFTPGITADDVSVVVKYSWDNAGWFSLTDLPLKTNVGFYTLYYKLYTDNTSIEIDTSVDVLSVEIIKANINVARPNTMAGNSLTYKAADYHLFLNAGDYGIIKEYDDESYETLTDSSGNKLTYQNREVASAGNMGTIYYGCSTNANIKPATWETDYTKVVARVVGNYYVWMKVDAGDNHNGKSAVCYNTNDPIKIVPAKLQDEGCLYQNIYVTQTKFRAHENLRYNGSTQYLIDNLQLNVFIADRNDYGDVIGPDGNVVPSTSSYDAVKYNSRGSDSIGKPFYALRSSATDYPALTDFSETGWQESWGNLRKVDAGTYHLMVMFKKDESSNINTEDTETVFSFSLLNPWDGSTRDEIKIAPATYDDIKVSGIFGLESMYAGKGQKLAYGELVVTHTELRKNLTSQIFGSTYCYVKPDDFPPTINSTWTAFNDTKVTNVGEYQLYVKLNTSSNIDSVTKPLIYPLFSEVNYAEITRVDANNLDIVAPGFINSLSYNGLEQSLLNQKADLKIRGKDAGPLNSALGAVSYFISGSPTEITESGTVAGGEVAYSNFADVKEKNAGTYYIWVAYAQGDSHMAVAPRYVGEVSIATATRDEIKLSGIEFTSSTYNGEAHKLIKSTVIQRFENGDKILTIGDEYSKIEYAYSNDPTITPVADSWRDETNLDLLTGLDADKYYIWIRVTSLENTVTKKKNVDDYVRCYSDVSYAEIIRATLNNNNFDGVLLHNDLVYIAEDQVLASIPDKLTLTLDNLDKDLNTAEYNKDLNIYWALGSGTGVNNLPDDGAWVSNIAENQGKNHGDYFLWIWVPESKNINEYKSYYATIHIKKATIHFTQKPVVYDDLVYTGDYQKLVSAAPVIKFYAVGDHYNPEKFYYDAFEASVEYSISPDLSCSSWVKSYSEIKGIDAVTYVISYRVPESNNWNLAQEDIVTSIAAVDASTMGVGLFEAPKALENVTYNEKSQDLISFGLLTDNLAVAGRGAALEGSKIVFYYADDDRQTEYKYYYDVESNEYVWDSVNGPLPGRTVVGNYHIRYYITESASGNFKASAVFDLHISIAQRPVYWETNPESIYGLKFTSNEQPILYAGVLNVGKTDPRCSAEGVRVLYTLDEPGTDRHWQEDIPVVDYPDLWYVWYRVEVGNNNVFVGPENNDPDEGTMVVVLIEKNILTIRDLPRPNILQYTAEEQSLVDYYYLSTDTDRESFGDNAPFVEYSFDKNASDDEWSREIKAKERGEYTVYYRLNYNDVLFEFRGENDGRSEPMQLTVVIETRELTFDSLHAVFNPDDGSMSYKADMKESFNYETGEYDLVPMYSDAFLAELEPYMYYYYRKGDDYAQDVTWLPWVKGETAIDNLGLGSFQFMLTIVPPEDIVWNFTGYTQAGYVEPYDSYTNKEDRVIQIIMPEKQYNTPAYVRAWIDLTLTTKFEDAKFKYEGWVEKNGKLEIPFFDVDSTGRYGGAVIRLQTVNASYYYMSEDALSNDNKAKIELTSSKVKNVVNAFNPGLIEPYKTIYLYEIYRIQYDANGGIGDDLEEGWKWHNLDYRLEENKFTKIEDGKSLTANGWNTSKAGNGNNYNSGSMYYRENASQVFYAKFFMPGENFYTIEWVIDNGSKRYTLSRDFGVWFDVTNPSYESRSTGMLIAEGDLIVLPQIQVDENNESLSGIFGGYILGWHTVEDNTPYSVGITATRNVTFIAELSADLDNYVECEFKDESGDVIHYSGQVADGAKAYMALSGMSANTIKEYNTGYTAWVQRYGFDYLDSSKTPDGVLRYDLGAKTAIEEQPATNQEQITWDDYIPMFIILALGVVATVASLTVYIIMRKKHKLSI